jgi:hypothetical protein
MKFLKPHSRIVGAICTAAVLGILSSSPAQSAAPPYRPPPGVAAGPSLVPAPSLEPPRAGAKFDMTGYWVSIVSEDYQWRMITPPKGDFVDLPLSAAAVAIANKWDLGADNAAGLQCKAFGAPGIMRIPGRVHVTWADDTTLKLETDAGQQTRLFRFGNPTPPAGESGWQGFSVAAWQKVTRGSDVFSLGQGFGRVMPGPGGSLRVVTTHLQPGYLRKNGIPFGSQTVLTEYFNRIEEPNGDSWLIVTTIMEDPEYLTLPYITSTHFLREPDAAKWKPAPCHTDPPLRDKAPRLQE